jgi:hypothetical protein
MRTAELGEAVVGDDLLGEPLLGLLLLALGQLQLAVAGQAHVREPGHQLGVVERGVGVVGLVVLEGRRDRVDELVADGAVGVVEGRVDGDDRARVERSVADLEDVGVEEELVDDAGAGAVAVGRRGREAVEEHLGRQHAGVRDARDLAGAASQGSFLSLNLTFTP